jgi:excisionase family DNA binding protein
MKRIILEEINTAELKSIISEVVNQELSKFMSKPESSEDDYFLTRKEVAKILKISLPTLHNLVNENKITAYVIGKNSIRFKRDEVINFSLAEIKNFKQEND